MRPAPVWVESERKGHFPAIDSAQIQYRIAPSFFVGHRFLYCIRTPAPGPRCTASSRLENSPFPGIMFKVRLGTGHQRLLCCTYLSNMWHWGFDVENNNKSPVTPIIGLLRNDR
jgi:hypothetical protein